MQLLQRRAVAYIFNDIIIRVRERQRYARRRPWHSPFQIPSLSRVLLA